MVVENADLLNSIVGHGTAIPTYSNANRSTSMSIYRRLYEQAHGPIPKDKQGRSYEIHHIDGNRKNNPVYKYIADGTSHLLGERNPVHKLLKEGKHNTQIQVTCPHCNKTGSQPAMIRWHFDNCKRKTNE